MIWGWLGERPHHVELLPRSPRGSRCRGPLRSLSQLRWARGLRWYSFPGWLSSVESSCSWAGSWGRRGSMRSTGRPPARVPRALPSRGAPWCSMPRAGRSSAHQRSCGSNQARGCSRVRVPRSVGRVAASPARSCRSPAPRSGPSGGGASTGAVISGGAGSSTRSTSTRCAPLAHAEVAPPVPSIRPGAVPRRRSAADSRPSGAALARGMVLGQDDASTSSSARTSSARALRTSSRSAAERDAPVHPRAAVPARARAGPRTRVLVPLALIAVYVPLAGAGASLQRAGVMGAAGLIAAAASGPRRACTRSNWRPLSRSR